MKQAEKLVFENPQAVAAAFAEKLLSWIPEEGPYHIALSGGSTPKLLFRLLAKSYIDKLPWDRIHFWWGDERCVPPGDPESNFGVTHDLLLSRLNIPAENVHRIRGEDEPEVAAKKYSDEIKKIIPVSEHLPVFNLIILGMGDDGHTASIFPYQLHLLESPNICEVATHPDSGQKRVTLTGRVINAAARVAFLVTGVTKAERAREIFRQEDEARRYPAAYISPEEGELCWFLDKAAAAGI